MNSALAPSDRRWPRAPRRYQPGWPKAIANVWKATDERRTLGTPFVVSQCSRICSASTIDISETG